MAGKRREVVVVTGASAGVGRAVAREFGRRGARVGLLARGEEGLEAAKREVEELGGEALVVPTDVADAAAVEAAAAAVEEAFGPLDVWVNNAFAGVFSPFAEMTPEELEQVTAVTYFGTAYGTMAALRRMRLRDHGTIVQVGSALAYRAIPLQSAYCGAKHAIQGMTESIRSELQHERSGVWITMVQLPALNTPQFSWVKTRLPRHPQPVPPIYQPEVAARAVYWAAHHRRRELWVGAPTPIVLIGNTVLPGVGDRYLAKTGFDGQQTDEPVQPGRPDNLWAPLPGDWGAHGEFDDRAKRRSFQLWVTTHRSRAALGAVAVLGGIAALGRRRG